MPFIAPLFAFGDSVIDAFNPTTWAFEGSIDVNPGAGNAPGGLWSMRSARNGRTHVRLTSKPDDRRSRALSAFRPK
jgi:hypothetical protein